MSFSYYGELCTEVYDLTKKVGHSFGGDVEYYRVCLSIEKLTTLLTEKLTTFFSSPIFPQSCINLLGSYVSGFLGNGTTLHQKVRYVNGGSIDLAAL
ncbi:MAG: methyltransferase [Bacilli bacterium]|nr:methyltransferase [Bacilli bacterium]